jgi:beta-galactosidase
MADVFRAPKLAAAVYASQMDPAVRPVLQAATRWKVGDQAGFDPNEQTMKAGHDAPLVVFSNCDRVHVHIGGQLKGEFLPARDRFPHLPHPPFFCTGLGTLWGPSWQELRVVGLVGATVVAEQRFPAHNDATGLAVSVDDTTLRADGADMTRVLIAHTDEFGNPQGHSRVAVLIDVDGPATLVGPSPCALAGGVAGVYLRAGTVPGRATLTVCAPDLGQTRRVQVRVGA